jgi:oxygen-independent coproporphyrinogen-3 oxidase
MLAHPGLYVHYPWCIKKCPYCDFNSHPLKANGQTAAYGPALLRDWENQQADVPSFASVFFGGGTPSLFDPSAMAHLLDEVPLTESAEVTMEANPGTHEHADFAAYKDAGINRLSIGAQSFNDEHLRRLGRIHVAAETRTAFAKAREAGFDNVNLDLMWGLPGQGVEQALSDLEQAVALNPEHISWYQLTIEPKTEFAKRPPILPVEATVLDIEAAGLRLLEGAGYARYEVSGFAIAGAQCAHNRNYWEFGDYVGIGAGAHGKLTHTSSDGRLIVIRTRKASQPRLYLSDPTGLEREVIDDEALPLEFLMNALRLVEGVSWPRYQERTGLDPASLQPVWSELADLGLVRRERCSTTPAGLRHLDTVLQKFV